MNTANTIGAFDWTDLAQNGLLVIPIIVLISILPIIKLVLLIQAVLIEKRIRDNLPKHIDHATKRIEQNGGTIANIQNSVVIFQHKVKLPGYDLTSRIDVEYPTQQGTWFLLITRRNIIRWIWCDSKVKSNPPINSLDVMVDHKIRATTTANALMFGIGGLVLIACISCLIAWGVNHWM